MPSIKLRQQAFDNTAQAILISRATGGKIVICNKATAGLLGYSATELLAKTWSSFFKRNDKSLKKIRKQVKANGRGASEVCMIKKGGELFTGDLTTVRFFDEKGSAYMVTTIVDKSKGIRFQQAVDSKNKKTVAHDILLAKSRQKGIDAVNNKRVESNILIAAASSDKRFKLIVNSSSDIFYDIDLVTNFIILSDAYEKQFGYKMKKNMLAVDAWASHIHPEDYKAVIADYMQMLPGRKTEWKYNFRFLKADHTVATVLSSAIVLRDSAGIAYRMVGFMQDVSKQTALEKALKDEIGLKEKEIHEAMEMAKKAARFDLGHELHDNVNQLLAVSRMYLQMAKGGGSNSELYLSRSSEYSLNAIDAIRTLSHRLTRHNMLNSTLGEAIETTCRDMREVGNMEIALAADELKESLLSEKVKVTIFRIIQEQLNNIVKHAKAASVKIKISQSIKTIRLTITDDGIGFKTGKNKKGIGLKGIQSRAAALNGTAVISSRPREGCVLSVLLPFEKNK